MKFIRFTPAHQPGDVFVRNDAVTSVQPNVYSGALFSGEPLETPAAINTTGGGTVIVKESPAQVIAALRAAENTHYVTVEYVMDDGDTSSLADDCECNCGMTCCDDEPDAADHALALKEAQADAKIADERAEWYKKRVEQLLDARASSLMAFNRVSVERDSLLAKLKDTTAALEKANAELNAARYGKFWSGDVWSRNGFVGNATGTDPGAKMY